MIKNDVDIEPTSEQVGMPGRSFFSRAVITRDSNLTRLFIMMIAIFIAMSLALPDTFPTLRNFNSMSVQFPEVGILAIAVMITMLTGGIDLSVVSIGNLTATLTALTLTQLVPPDATGGPVVIGISLALLVALVTGLMGGLLNGFLIANVGITPILATLGTMTLYAGFSIVITKGTSFFAVPQFLFIGDGTILGLPVPLIIFAVLILIFSVLLSWTTFGFRLYMLGTNPTAAHFSGIDNRNVLIKTYILSGLLGAVAGIIFLARTNSAKADYGISYVLQAILVAILGGINPMGGFGKISGLVLAILSLQFLSTGLNMLLVQYSGSNFFKEFAWGALLLLVMVINYLSNKQQSRGPTK